MLDLDTGALDTALGVGWLVGIVAAAAEALAGLAMGTVAAEQAGLCQNIQPPATSGFPYCGPGAPDSVAGYVY